MPQSNPFDQFDGSAKPVPVAQIAPLRPILTDPNKDQNQARLDATARTDTAKSTYRTMTPDEARQQGLPVDGVYQINGLGEVKRIASAPAGEQKINQRVAKLNTLLEQIDRTEELHRANLAGGLPAFIGGNIPFRPEVEQFNSAAAGMAEQGLSAFRVPGVGSQSDAELRQFVKANQPLATDSDLAVQEKFKTLRLRAQSELAGIDPTYKMPTADAPPPADPNKVVSGTGNFLSDKDKELQALLTDQFTKGATLETLQGIAQEYGQRVDVGTQAELDALREKGAGIVVDPTGQRSKVEALIGAAADSPGGAYAVGAANALTLGAMDELAPLIGIDADTAQAAKEMLRERYPVSSFAGEVAGQGMQLAAGGAGVRALGGGAPALAGTEIAQSAAYGAGESNDNRVLGAAMGAGAAVVGQRIGSAIASRFNAPEAKAALDRLAAETGAPPEAVQQAILDAADRVPGAARPTAAVTPEAATQFGEVARAAVGRGSKARTAKEQLAIAAKINPEAKAAAERLGIEVPLDVISDDARLLTTTGLARSQIGSTAQGEWGATVRNAIERSDATLAEIGASRDLAQLSDDVRARLTAETDGLESSANMLRSEVNDAINVRDAVKASNLCSELGNAIEDLGGIAEAKQAFSPEEKKLLAMLGEGADAKLPTYARLNQLRDQIGRAIYKNEGPWVDAPTATLKRYYGALAKDQLDYVESVGGKELADKMRGSNELYTRMFQGRETMQSVFGKQLERDIGGLVTRAVLGATKGDARDLRLLLNAVPDDLKARTLLSGIMAKADRNSAGGGFSFTEYAKLYRGMRQNEPIYQEVAKTAGPDATRIMQDLYVLSSRMAAAEGKIVRTGASNQPILNALKAETLTARTMEATKRVGARTMGAMAGGAVGGFPGAAAGQEVASALQSALTQGGKSNIDKLHTLLSSEGFRDLVEKVGTGEGVDRAINRVANDGPFRRFARSVLSLKNPDDRKSWLMRAIEVSPTVVGVEAGTTEQPAMIEVR